MKVYLVSTGSYSDYMVLGIYSTLEKAKKAKTDYGAENDIEEREVDKFPHIPEGMQAFEVAMTCVGGLIFPPKRVNPCGIDNFCERWAPWSTLKVPEKQGVYFRMWARDENHAIKIANDRRAQLIATGEWTTDWHEWMCRKTP